MKIYIKNMKDIDVAIDINENDTILDVKRKYGKINIILKYNTQILNDNKTISFYEIEDGDILFAIEKILGGGTGSTTKGLDYPTKKDNK